MIKSKKQMFIVISVFTLVMLLGTVTYAFFNYTRTGAQNRISVGDIYFTSDYTNVELDSVFPIDKANVSTDTDNVMSVNVDVEGHTTYEHGIYYEVTADDVNLTVNGKNIPIGISVTSSDLDNVTLTNYEDGKVLTDGSLFAKGRILASENNNDNSVDGTITIKAYLDKDRIAISDTYNGLETDNMGTTNGWVNGRVVLTTSEWNSLSSTPISFKVKVEAYENDVSTLVSGIQFSKKIRILSGSISEQDVNEYDESSSAFLDWLENEATPEQIDEVLAYFGVTTIEEAIEADFKNSYGWRNHGLADNNITSFQRVTTAPDTTNFTENNIISTEDSIYPVYAWYDNGVIKYYSESNNIKANNDMHSMFSNLYSLTSIDDFANLDTTNVIDMEGVFSGCSFESLSFLANWNVNNVRNMEAMFADCGDLTNISALSNWNVLNVVNMNDMFLDCSSLLSLSSLSNWNVSQVTNMENMFMNCSSITTLTPLANWNVSNVTNMWYMFRECGITTLDGLNNWNVSNVTEMRAMFLNCTSLSDASAINDWNIINVNADGFYYMFKSALAHPTFSKRAGTWSNGTFTPSA